uniref:Uncharacterized protein n=1 Tax=Arundo donax TaxID=35708 RepID=A0A0A9DNZ6_ARUDO
MPLGRGSAVQLRRSSAPENQTPKMRSNWRPRQSALHSSTASARDPPRERAAPRQAGGA